MAAVLDSATTAIHALLGCLWMSLVASRENETSSESIDHTKHLVSCRPNNQQNEGLSNRFILRLFLGCGGHMATRCYCST